MTLSRALEAISARSSFRLAEWKGGRVYINGLGPRTSSSSTKVYIDTKDDCKVVAYVKSDAQPVSWCISQAKKVREKVEPVAAALRQLLEQEDDALPARFDLPLPEASTAFVPMRWHTKPYQHQVAALEKMLPLPFGALFMEMGTGKTKVAFDLFASKKAAGQVDALLWLGPLNTFSHISEQVAQHLGEHYAVCMVGLESLSQTAKAANRAQAFIDQHKRVMLVVDEAHLLKNPTTIRSWRTKALAEQCPTRYVLTGTPITQSPGDLFGIFQAADPTLHTIGYASYGSFERQHLLIEPGHRRRVIGHRNIDQLTARLEPFIYQVRKADCLDLPKKSYQRVVVDLTAKQERVYHDTKKEMLAHYEQTRNENIIMLMFTRLQQIAGGLHPEGHALPSGKGDALAQLLTAIDGPVVVWGKYRFELELCQQHVGERPAYFFHGGISQDDRAANLAAWRSSANGVLLATPATGGVGLDLLEAHTAIYYSNSFKYMERIQSEDRLHRIGRTRACHYVDVQANCGIERQVASCLARKEDLLDTFRQMLDQNQEEAWLKAI